MELLHTNCNAYILHSTQLQCQPLPSPFNAQRWMVKGNIWEWINWYLKTFNIIYVFGNVNSNFTEYQPEMADVYCMLNITEIKHMLSIYLSGNFNTLDVYSQTLVLMSQMINVYDSLMKQCIWWYAEFLNKLNIG